MRIVLANDTDVMAMTAADLVEGLLAQKPAAHLVLPTGASPLPLYRELVRRKVDLSAARLTKLDEWYRLPRRHPATCEAFLWEHLLEPLRYPRDRFLAFDSDADDPSVECRRMGRAFEERGPADLCILGLGMNGHLGLIEPAEALPLHAHVAALSEESRRHPMLSGVAEPPTRGLTLGIADLLQSKEILFLVSGAHKADVFRRWEASPLATTFPSSTLHLHPNVTTIVDREAAYRSTSTPT
ncbi:MAG TPA: 6-phosphogluconolactonase [Fimbriimonas sp.]